MYQVHHMSVRNLLVVVVVVDDLLAEMCGKGTLMVMMMMIGR
jgi:hypothetical protein